MFIKTFIRLLLAATIPWLVLLLPFDEPLIDDINVKLWQERIDNTFKGPFYLLERRLNKHPQQEWPNKFKALQDLYDYQLNLVSLDEYADDQSFTKCLLKQKFCVYDVAEVTVIVRLVKDTNWVIEMFLDQSEQEDIRRTASGTFKLMSEYFDEYPKHQWQQAFNEINTKFGFPIEVSTYESLKLTPSEIIDLQQTATISRTNGDDEIVLIHQLSDGRPLVKIGPLPMSGSPLSITMAIYGTFIGSISLSLLIFVYILWRDINKLTKVATRFGDGHLAQRSNLSKRSVLSPLANSFDNMAQRIQSTITSQRDLTNAVAHDLRTPLSRLSFALEMIDSDDISPADKQRYCDTMSSSIDTLDHLIQQMLLLARYTRATDINHFSDTVLAQILNDEIELLKPEYPQLTFTLNIKPQLLQAKLFIDQRAILRALNNLVSNASRYANDKVDITLTIEKEYLCLSVSDDGPGIPEALRERVLKPFAQLDNDTRNKDTEHGLGLAIVNQIANWHQGHVHISDSLLGQNGNGAKVTLCWLQTKEK